MNGVYYIFDCFNAILEGRYWPEKAFNGDGDAIKTARDYEAVLYKVEFLHDNLIDRIILYNPFDE